MCFYIFSSYCYQSTLFFFSFFSSFFFYKQKTFSLWQKRTCMNHGMLKMFKLHAIHSFAFHLTCNTIFIKFGTELRFTLHSKEACMSLTWKQLHIRTFMLCSLSLLASGVFFSILFYQTIFPAHPSSTLRNLSWFTRWVITNKHISLRLLPMKLQFQALFFFLEPCFAVELCR